ncbi:MAG: thiamine pyrophosphate-dependent enzyme [Planctomycetota bacterium]|jgi:indolepyruvate ferredoxin oxidoreductase alpha subunit
MAKTATRTEVLLGNGAIARGLIEAGCDVLCSYPGTPSSEIVPEAVRFKKEENHPIYIEWSTNEKVAFDNAFAACLTGKRAAVCMKQVGLNVAADSLMSAAYQGVVGGLVVISCDDPGPHSSQTEQDTRLFAYFAKVPVFDPSTPEMARDMIIRAFEYSEEYRTPFIVRPGIRVCHARQAIRLRKPKVLNRKAKFKKDPERWAATPRYRYVLHKELNEKLAKMAVASAEPGEYNHHDAAGRSYPLGIIAGGVPLGNALDILGEFGVHNVPVCSIGAAFPFPLSLVEDFRKRCTKILVLEETDAVIEFFMQNRENVMGRISGHVPSAGELVPEIIYNIMRTALMEAKVKKLPELEMGKIEAAVADMSLPTRKPRLCAGCPHRASFYAIRKAFPKGIYTSDIGCYTLGTNLKAVDTVLDMGSGITMASGFYQAHKQDGQEQPVIATMGDSTFYHSGLPSLLNGVYNDARFILVLLDNDITAMTGMQPTPGLGIRADGSEGKKIPLERAVEGCGVDWIRVIDSYDVTGLIELLKEAYEYAKMPDGGIAVIISRHPCIIKYPPKREHRIEIDEELCNGCGICANVFECPALVQAGKKEKVTIDRRICVDCGVCVVACKEGAMREVQ